MSVAEVLAMAGLAAARISSSSPMQRCMEKPRRRVNKLRKAQTSKGNERRISHRAEIQQCEARQTFSTTASGRRVSVCEVLRASTMKQEKDILLATRHIPPPTECLQRMHRLDREKLGSPHEALRSHPLLAGASEMCHGTEPEETGEEEN